jgi:RNA polymerase sigma-70 factor (ECF subfamily)
MDAVETTSVLSRARQGDSEAFQILVERHGRAAFQVAWRITGNEQDAEDVVQESFIRAYRNLGGFESRAHFGTWLHRIVANCALDALRGRHTRLEHFPGEPLGIAEAVPAGDPGPERLAESSELGRRIATVMDELTPLERAAFALRHHEGRSIHEIGKTLGLGTSAAKHAVFRAVRKLRARLGPLHNTARAGEKP